MNSAKAILAAELEHADYLRHKYHVLSRRAALVAAYGKKRAAVFIAFHDELRREIAQGK